VAFLAICFRRAALKNVIADLMAARSIVEGIESIDIGEVLGVSGHDSQAVSQCDSQRSGCPDTNVACFWIGTTHMFSPIFRSLGVKHQNPIRKLVSKFIDA
jgi:hypothetical protein